MPHIDGHVEDAASSCGILSLKIEQKREREPNKRKGLYFIPPLDFTVKEGDNVEFVLLEIPTEGGPILVAYGLILKNKKDLKEDEHPDKIYKQTTEYKRYYNGKPNPQTAIKNIYSKLKTVGELRRIKAANNLTSRYLKESSQKSGSSKNLRTQSKI
jgi:hypothetical protein